MQGFDFKPNQILYIHIRIWLMISFNKCMNKIQIIKILELTFHSWMYFFLIIIKYILEFKLIFSWFLYQCSRSYHFNSGREEGWKANNFKCLLGLELGVLKCLCPMPEMICPKIQNNVLLGYHVIIQYRYYIDAFSSYRHKQSKRQFSRLKPPRARLF